MRLTVLAVTLLVLASPALAETRDELQASGEALGREGKWGEAIHAFKAAERIEHRAVHACLIALAYTRREAWPQAEVFLSRCHESSDTLPDWVAELDALIAKRIQDETLTELAIEVVPAGAAATLTASSFEPDEVFTPRTIHVPRGTLLIVAHAPGYPEQQRVVVVDSARPRKLVIDMLAKPGMTTRTKLLIAGGVVIGLGALSYAAMGYTYLHLEDSAAYNNGASTGAETAYKITRVTTIGCWAIGAGLVVAGVLTHRKPEATQVSAAPIAGGAMVTIGWSR